MRQDEHVTRRQRASFGPWVALERKMADARGLEGAMDVTRTSAVRSGTVAASTGTNAGDGL